MEHPKAKGDRSTMAIILALHEAGLAVYLSTGHATTRSAAFDQPSLMKSAA